MIKTKNDLKYYLECDKVALKIPSSRKWPRPIFDSIWKYEIILRKAEYHKNNDGLLHKIFYGYERVRLEKLGIKLSIFIRPNVFGAGLSIAHYGGIVVNQNARIGSNCRIHEGVTIGATNGSNKAAVIGDNCFIGSGAKIIGELRLGNNVTIGAGTVVIKSVGDDNATLVGNPARLVNHNGSDQNVVNATAIVEDTLTKERSK